MKNKIITIIIENNNLNKIKLTINNFLINMDIYIFNFIYLSENNILKALNYKNNDEIISFFNNYLFYNKQNILLSRYNRENKPKIYKNIGYFEYNFNKIFNTNYSFISFKSSKLQLINFNKSQIKNIYKPSDFFIPKETINIIKIFYKKELNYIADNIGKGNEIIKKYSPINEPLKKEFVYPLLKSLLFRCQFSASINLIIKPEIISNNNIIINYINKIKINYKEVIVTVIYLENSQINNKNDINIKHLPKSEVEPKIKINKRKFEIKNRNKKNIDKKLDYFTSKDIQDQNKEITRLFQKVALNLIGDDEEIENEKIAQVLKKVAFISRKAYNISNKLFIYMFEEFLESTKQKKPISTFNKDEKLKKEFSSWVKEYEKETEGNENYENYFNSCKNENKDIFDDNITYLFTLLPQLITLYFHCELSFPNVDVIFDCEKKFNQEKMIDFINKGNKREVNFVILPSLFSNGNYLDNGKFWVFTYKKNTYKFDNLKFENLVDKQKKFS